MGCRARRKAGPFDALDPGPERIEPAAAELLLDPEALDEDRPGPGFDGAVDLIRHLPGLAMALGDPCLEAAPLSL